MPDVIRTQEGTFAPGVSGNPNGRPKGKKNELTELQQDLEVAVRKSLTSERVVGIINKLATMAEEGNVKAAKLLLDKFIPNAAPSTSEEADRPSFVIRIENATVQAQRNELDAIDVTIPQLEQNS